MAHIAPVSGQRGRERCKNGPNCTCERLKRQGQVQKALKMYLQPAKRTAAGAKMADNAPANASGGRQRWQKRAKSCRFQEIFIFL